MLSIYPFLILLCCAQHVDFFMSADYLIYFGNWFKCPNYYVVISILESGFFPLGFNVVQVPIPGIDVIARGIVILYICPRIFKFLLIIINVANRLCAWWYSWLMYSNKFHNRFGGGSILGILLHCTWCRIRTAVHIPVFPPHLWYYLKWARYMELLATMYFWPTGPLISN